MCRSPQYLLTFQNVPGHFKLNYNVPVYIYIYIYIYRVQILFVNYFFVLFLFFSLGHFSLLSATFWSKNLYFAEFWN